jgi:transposase
MRKIRDVLRLRAQGGLSHQQIATSLGLGRTTVTEYLRRAQDAGLGWPLPVDLDEAGLETRLFPPVIPFDRRPRALPDWPVIHTELRRPEVTLFLLWQEYRASHPDGYQYSRFCDLYGRFAARLNPSMRQIHRAGEKAFVDFSGRKPHWVDPRTGEVREVELFVGALGASGRIYAEAVPDQTLPSWIGAHQRMFAFNKGCTAILVPDNLKSGITRPCRYEPGVNRTYEEMAEHYGAVVIPARVRKPQDKAVVELSVRLAQRWILARLRHQTFFSLTALNAAIWQELEALNARPIRRLGVSREELYERLDRPALKPLPSQPYELALWSQGRAGIDYHLEVEHNLYSVPHQLMKEPLEARMTLTTVEILFRSRRVASHPRLFGRGQYSTQTEHMPAAHRAHLEWTPSRLVRWAEQTGPAAAALVTAILESRPHPEQGYRACLGLMRLGKSFGAERLEAAAARALHLRAYSYRTVKNILAAGTDRLPLEPEATAAPVPGHENVRGAAYYQPQEAAC